MARNHTLYVKPKIHRIVQRYSEAMGVPRYEVTELALMEFHDRNCGALSDHDKTPSCCKQCYIENYNELVSEEFKR